MNPSKSKARETTETENLFPDAEPREPYERRAPATDPVECDVASLPLNDRVKTGYWNAAIRKLMTMPKGRVLRFDLASYDDYDRYRFGLYAAAERNGVKVSIMFFRNMLYVTRASDLPNGKIVEGTRIAPSATKRRNEGR